MIFKQSTYNPQICTKNEIPMDDDHTRDSLLYFTSTLNGINEWYKKFVDSCKTAEPRFIGVDWAADSGMNRGDIVKREGNVVHARFKTVGV